MVEEIRSLASRHLDFGFESTLSGRAHLQLIRELKEVGYAVHIFFLWIPDTDFAVSRVKARVAAGRHSVAEATVRRRFERSIATFFRYYQPQAYSWLFVDNSLRVPKVLAAGVGAKEHRWRGDVYALLKSRYCK